MTPHCVVKMPSNKREKIPEGTLCVVCQDLASGIHYSVASCNGCKTFFRRALVNKQTFQCQFSGDCAIGKSVRCVCRSCRLKKCFDMGMDPKAIQHDRDKIRYTKQLRKQREAERAAEQERLLAEQHTEVKEEVGSPQSLNSENYMNTSTPSSSTAINPDQDICAFESDLKEMRTLVSELITLEDKVVSIRNARIFESHTSATTSIHTRRLLEDDHWIAQNSSPMCTPIATPCSLELLRNWFVRDLSLMIEWGKTIRTVKEKLLLSDKLALMKSFAPLWPLLHLAFYTSEDNLFSNIKCEPGETVVRLNYPDGTYIDKYTEMANTGEMFPMLTTGVYKMMRELRLEKEHIVLYKMLLLHNPDAEGLSKPGKETIEIERSKLLSYLYMYIVTERGKDAAHIYSNLLMMTSTLSRVASFIRRIFDINHIFDRTNDLIDQLIIVGL